METNECKNNKMNFFRKKVLTPFIAIILALCCIAATALTTSLICFHVNKPTEQTHLTYEQLYRASVIDSITVEDDEIFPLVTLTPGSDMATFRDGKVLLMTYNRRPERYVAGTTLTLTGEVWTITEKELYSWYYKNRNGVTDWSMRFKQLVGVPPDGVYTHMTAMWVSLSDIRRPAYLTDITDPHMQAALPETADADYVSWFHGNIIWSYFDSAYPWTRLGYTYDWAADSGEYGLTEFWVAPGAVVTVEFTDTVPEFLHRLEQAAA